MPNIQKILFPTSCSENAKKAFRYILSMAKYFGASVDVLKYYFKKKEFLNFNFVKPEDAEYMIMTNNNFDVFKSW